jgi:transcriptional regulator
MKYSYTTMKASVVALRNSGKSVDEINKTLKIGEGEVRMMTRESALSKTAAAAIVKRRKALKYKRPA